jgi:low molecular weight phosphotyrosine protein phosphatase
MDTLRKHGIRDYDHGARKIQEKDFRTFDYILAMDTSNLRDLQRVQKRVDSASGKSKAKIMLFGEFSGKLRAEQVGDPYYGEDDGFEEVYEQVSRFSKRFLQEVFDKAPTGTQT